MEQSKGAGGRCFCFWRLGEAEARAQWVVLCPVWESSEAKGGWEVSAERGRTAGSRLGSGREKEPRKPSLKLLQQLQPRRCQRGNQKILESRKRLWKRRRRRGTSDFWLSLVALSLAKSGKKEQGPGKALFCCTYIGSCPGREGPLAGE